jgi:transketolase
LQLKAQVEYFGRALVEKGATDPNLVVLDADVSASTKTVFFQETYPDRFIQVGISEQDLLGVASGLAVSGKTPVAAAFATFIVGRAWEQLFNTIARQNLNVKIVGTHSGLSPSADGESHQSIADIATVRVIPHLSVVVPADAASAGCLTREIIDHRGPVYLRLSRGSTPTVYPDDVELKIGRSEIITEGSDVAIIAIGNMVHIALQAAKSLQGDRIEAKVIDMHTVKPLDQPTVIRLAEETGALVTVEEHSVIGGLGGAVSEVLSENNPTPHRRVGVTDRFGTSSRNYQLLLERYNLTPSSVVKAVKNVLKAKKK